MEKTKEKLKLRWEEDGFFLDQPDGKSVPVEVDIKIVMVKGNEGIAGAAILRIVQDWIDKAEIIG